MVVPPKRAEMLLRPLEMRGGPKIVISASLLMEEIYEIQTFAR